MAIQEKWRLQNYILKYDSEISSYSDAQLSLETILHIFAYGIDKEGI